MNNSEENLDMESSNNVDKVRYQSTWPESPKDSMHTFKDANAVSSESDTNTFSNGSLVGATDLEKGSISSESIKDYPALTTARTIIIISTMAAVTFISSLSIGLVTVSLPYIAADLELPDGLMLWPGSVYSLATGCCLLPAGSIADRIGNRASNLVGTFLLMVFIAASGGAQSGIQFIIFRAIQGIGAAICFPSAVSILTNSFPVGRVRNLAFSFLCIGQPLGFQIGLTLSGVFVQSAATWRLGFYVCSGATALFLVSAFWCLPRDRPRELLTWDRFIHTIDWIGLAISSISMGLLSYVLAVVAQSASDIHQPVNIALLVIAIALALSFPFWMQLRERAGKVALIPNSLWRNTVFSSICAMVLLSWAVVQSSDYFFSLFYQRVQHISAIETSTRFLPTILVGLVINLTVGLFVHRIPINVFVIAGCVITGISTLLMALIDIDWNWWLCGFWVMLLNPFALDATYVVANLLITDTFPQSTQALAGAVFNVIGQLGTALGISIMAVIAQSVTNDNLGRAPAGSINGTSIPTAKSGTGSVLTTPAEAAALMLGYRAAFWTALAWMVIAVAVGVVGLRKCGRVGISKKHGVKAQKEGREINHDQIEKENLSA